MFQKTANTQTLPLYGITQGRRTVIAITAATSNCTLEFKHSGDTTWRVDPRFSGVHSNGTIIGDILPVSSVARLNFVNPPGGDYYVSVVCEISGD